MASKITYTDKEALYENPDIDDINKVNADDMNEIKRVVNENADLILGEEVAISTTEPTGDETIWINPTTKVPKFLYNGSWQELSMSLLDGMPIGFITAFAGSTIPTGWLECDGSTITQSAYPDLYALIGGTLPNFKGRAIVGQDTSDTDFDTIGATGGEKAHTLTVNEMPNHNHQGIFVDQTRVMWGGSTNNAINLQGTPFTAGDGGSLLSTEFTGGGQAHNILQPYGVAKWIIKAKNTTPTMASIVDAYSTSTTDAYSCRYVNNEIEDINEKINGYVLYDNSSGSNQQITLNDTVVNYSYLEITYKDDQNIYETKKINVINNAWYSLSVIQFFMVSASSTISRTVIRGENIKLEDNKIKNGNYNATEITNNATNIYDNNNIYITKVIGYK